MACDSLSRVGASCLVGMPSNGGVPSWLEATTLRNFPSGPCTFMSNSKRTSTCLRGHDAGDEADPQVAQHCRKVNMSL